MGKKNKLPDGWLDYEKVGRQVPGTRFIAFKVPLKETICKNNLKESEWFTPDILLETLPKLKLIINLTNTVSGRYYDYSFFKKNGVEILPLKCEGRGTLPPNKLMNAFYCAVDDFLRTNAADNDALIGVHCTHGLNRTGLFICKYMVERMGMPPTEAIQHFQTARGHKIERHQYLHAIATSDDTKTPMPEENVSSGFNQWIQNRQRNGYNNLRQNDSYGEIGYSNYRETGYNNYRENGYNNHRETGYNNHRENGYRNHRNTSGNREPSSSYDRQGYSQQQQHQSSFRDRAHPYQRNTSLPRRNQPPGRRRGRPQGPIYGSPLDNCYD